MFELVLTLCLAMQPNDCHIERLPFATYDDATVCVRDGLLRAVDFLEEHPDYRLSRWRCAPPEA